MKNKPSFCLKAYTYSGKYIYPVKINSIEIGNFTTLEDAESKIKVLLTEAHEHNISHFEIIEKDDKNRESEGLSIRIYTETGEFYNGRMVPYDTPFRGRDPHECRFRLGEIVEMVCNFEDTIFPVIVVGRPYTREWYESKLMKSCNLTQSEVEKFYIQGDDVYCVLFGEEEEHDHPPEYLLRPLRVLVPAKLSRRLKVRYESICERDLI